MAARRSTAVTPARKSGTTAGEALVESGYPGPATGPAFSIMRCMDPAASLNVLHSSKPGQQQIPFLPQGQFLFGLDIVATGKQAPGLQLQQHRRDQEELGGHFQIQGGPHLLQGGHVLVHDVGQRHLPEVDLVPGDEMQEQVERALEDGRAHRVGHGSDY